MTKQISNSTQPVAGLASTQYATYSPQTVHDTENPQQKIDAIAKEIESRNNIAYGVGRVLRNIWDYISENLQFGLPTAEAKLLPKYSSDPEVDHALSLLEVPLVVDKELRALIEANPKIKEEIEKRAKVITENLKVDFANAAHEGPETRKLVLECLSNTKIAIFDTKYSKFSIEAHEEKIGSEAFVGVYTNDLKQIIFSGRFDGGKNLGTIIHECSHAREFSEGANYDVAKMSQCVKNLKDLGMATAACIDDRHSVDCDDVVVDLAQNYQNRSAVIHRGMLHPENRKPGLLEVPTIGDRKLKLVAELSAADDQKFYSLRLHGTQNPKTRSITLASKEQENLYIMMYQNHRALSTYEEIAGLYPKGNTEEKVREFHATIVDNVPEAVLNRVCPDGLDITPTGNPVPTGGEKFNPSVKEL
ncbi:MAG: hypothetical protein KA100_06765 [Rickettsiales bacterium]|nr:hypothetical protein [Rickettsiales bacterium]